MWKVTGPLWGRDECGPLWRGGMSVEGNWALVGEG